MAVVGRVGKARDAGRSGGRVAVVGGGIAGLSAAWRLRDRVEVTVFEPGPVGGKLQTSELDGMTIDRGPDAFLTRTPEATGLLRELDLADTAISPAAGQTRLWRGGRLIPLPPGLVLGVPRELGPLCRTSALSVRAKLRAGLDLVLPATPMAEDLSVGDMVARRFGQAVADHLVEPLVGSIHAAGLSEISATAVTPQLVAVARKHRSLLLGLRSLPQPRPAPGGSPAPIFTAPAGGSAELVTLLVQRLSTSGVAWQSRAVGSVRPLGAGVEVDGERFDAVVLATPAATSARLLGPFAPLGLSSIEATTVVLVSIVYPDDDRLPRGVNGILADRQDRRLMTACSFFTNKWPSRARPGRAVVRLSTGWSGDQRAMDLEDAALVDRLNGELEQALGTSLSPGAYQVNRWPAAFPLYRPGHLTMVQRMEEELAATTPLIRLAGASYRGSGVPACIGSGQRAADEVAALLA